jgi:hypothetical protein
MTHCARLAVLLFLARNYQPSMSDPWRKSWTADASANEETAKVLAVTWLFFAVFVCKSSQSRRNCTRSEMARHDPDRDLHLFPISKKSIFVN